MKRIGIVIAVVLVLLIGIVFAKNIIAKTALSAGVKSITGLELSMSSMNVGIFKTSIGIKELKLYNPSGFPDKLMVDMPEIYVDYDLGAFLKRRVHLEEIRLNLKEFVVVRNKNGELNLNALKVVQAKKERKAPQEKRQKAKMPEFQIDSLELKIDKVIFKDYSRGTPPKIREFNVNIDERYENITDPSVLAGLIVTKALMNTTIGRLANFDLGPLKEGVTEVLSGTVETTKEIVGQIKETTEEAAEKVTDTIKKILPFGE